MFEKEWLAVAPQLFTVNGSPNGLITVADTLGFKVKAEVVIQATALPNLTVEVKRVLSKTQMYVGAKNKGINDRSVNLSQYTVAAGAFVYQDQQPRNTVSPADIIQAVYDQEPGVRIMVGLADSYGNAISESNPLPVAFDGTVSIGEVEVRGPSGNLLDPNSDGGIKTVQLFTKPFDAITATYPSPTQEVYQSRVGGIAGVVQETLTINYVDAAKDLIVNVARS